MKRHRSVKPLLALAGVAALGMSGMSCSSQSKTETRDREPWVHRTGRVHPRLGGRRDGLRQAQHTTVGADGTVNIDVAGGNGQVIDYSATCPAAACTCSRPRGPTASSTTSPRSSPRPTSRRRRLVRRASIVFSMKKSADDHYHIYTAQLASR